MVFDYNCRMVDDPEGEVRKILLACERKDATNFTNQSREIRGVCF
jgi:hypothetical protein